MAPWLLLVSLAAAQPTSVPASTQAASVLLAQLQSGMAGLRLDAGNRASQRQVFEAAGALAKVERLPSGLAAERPAAVEAARAYLEAENARVRRLTEELARLLKSAKLSDPATILEASNQADDVAALADNPQLAAYVQAIYARLSSAVERGLFTDGKSVLLARGYLYFHDKNWGMAEQEWSKAARLDPKDAALQALRARARDGAQRDQKLTRSVALMAKGRAYFDSGQYEKAVATMETLLSEQPDNAQAKPLLAASRAAFAEQDRRRRIAEAFSQGLELKRQRRYLEASQYFLKALQLEPDNAQARAQLQEMVVTLQTAARLTAPQAAPAGTTGRSQDLAESLYQEGLLLYVQGDKPGAKRKWESALIAFPAHARALAALERIKAEEAFSP